MIWILGCEKKGSHMRSIETRLIKLESKCAGDTIPVWCDCASEVEATLDEMIAVGELLVDDRNRCLHWTIARAVPGQHERSLAGLS